MKTLKVITALSARKTHLIRDRHQEQNKVHRGEASKNSHHEKQTEKKKEKPTRSCRNFLLP